MKSLLENELKLSIEHRIDSRIREMAIDFFFNGKKFINILATFRNIKSRPGKDYKTEDDNFAYSILLYSKLIGSGLISSNHLEYIKNIVDFKDREKFVFFWIENFVSFKEFDTESGSETWFYKKIVDAYANYFGSQIGEADFLNPNSEKRVVYRSWIYGIQNKEVKEYAYKNIGIILDLIRAESNKRSNKKRQQEV